MTRRTAKSGNDSAVIFKLSDSAIPKAFPTFPTLPLLPVNPDSQHSSSTTTLTGIELVPVNYPRGLETQTICYKGGSRLRSSEEVFWPHEESDISDSEPPTLRLTPYHDQPISPIW